MNPQIGISKDNLTKVAHALNGFLADEFLLYLKTRNAHWNIEGSDFHAMHKFFEEQYEQLDETMDDVAERIRALGHYAPATMKAYLELTHLTEESREKNDSAGFIKELLGDHESIIISIRKAIGDVDETYKDAGSTDFITGLMKQHEKIAWMIRSYLK